MNDNLVHNDFVKLIKKRGVHKELGVSSEYIRSLRNRIKKQKTVSIDAKLMLLKKSGWTHADKIYDRHDLIDFAKIILKTDDANMLGPGYFVDKFERIKNLN